jgi:hypothetical protein
VRPTRAALVGADGGPTPGFAHVMGTMPHQFCRRMFASGTRSVPERFPTALSVGDDHTDEIRVQRVLNCCDAGLVHDTVFRSVPVTFRVWW